MSRNHRLALLSLLALFWLCAGVLKFAVPNFVAFKQFSGRIVVGDALLSGVYIAIAGFEVLLALALILFRRSSIPARTSFCLASVLVLVQVAWGVDSTCGCFGMVQVSWPMRIVILATLVALSHIAGPSVGQLPDIRAKVSVQPKGHNPAESPTSVHRGRPLI